MAIKAARGLLGRNERGVTLLIVTVGMLSLLAMAVLAMDVVSLYVAKDQAQAAADASALGGAQALAISGTTSNPSAVPINSVCNGSSGMADSWAQAVAAQNSIAGGLGTVTTSCPSAPDGNPRMQVTITRPGIPTFFARIWGGGASTAAAAAVAEAYNPSFDSSNPGGPPIQIQGVKPWLIFNCNTCTSGGPAFFTSTYAIANGGAFIGQPVTFTLMASATSPTTTNVITPTSLSPVQFYALDGPAPQSCPSNGAVSCNQIGTGPPNLNYHDNIACTGSFKFGNNQSIPISGGPGLPPVQVDTRSLGTLQVRTRDGTLCLIHADNPGLDMGQDSFTQVTLPLTITGGYNNPDPALASVSGIQRSDSVVTAPVFNCPAAPATCDGTGASPLQIVGFLQLGIQDVTGSGDIHAVILNAAGTSPTGVTPPITGAGTSPIPVRLIQ
jgi:Flp pilus assembly protein TadG